MDDNNNTDDWVITLSYPISGVAPVNRDPFNSWLRDAMDSWETVLAPLDASVAQIPARGVIDVTAYHSGRENIVDTIVMMVSLISKRIGMSSPEAVEVVRESEHQRRADEPTMPELMSAAEIADELGISRQRVHQLRDTEAFPAPLADLRGGAVWDAQAVRKFNEGWERKPGRPKKFVHGTWTPSPAYIVDPIESATTTLVLLRGDEDLAAVKAVIYGGMSIATPIAIRDDDYPKCRIDTHNRTEALQ